MYKNCYFLIFYLKCAQRLDSNFTVLVFVRAFNNMHSEKLKKFLLKLTKKEREKYFYSKIFIAYGKTFSYKILKLKKYCISTSTTHSLKA